MRSIERTTVMEIIKNKPSFLLGHNNSYSDDDDDDDHGADTE